MKIINTTLALLVKEDKILLALKKRGFAKNKYNGIGGKLNPTETPEAAMIRETKEEINVTPLKYQKVGEIKFEEYYQKEFKIIKMHIYKIDTWDGIPTETAEMKPKWFKISEIPYNQMLPDDEHWLPLVINGKKIKAFFKFSENWDLLFKEITIIDKEIM